MTLPANAKENQMLLYMYCVEANCNGKFFGRNREEMKAAMVVHYQDNHNNAY